MVMHEVERMGEKTRHQRGVFIKYNARSEGRSGPSPGLCQGMDSSLDLKRSTTLSHRTRSFIVIHTDAILQLQPGLCYEAAIRGQLFFLVDLLLQGIIITDELFQPRLIRLCR
jgi:hypothetical protein